MKGISEKCAYLRPWCFSVLLLEAASVPLYAEYPMSVPLGTRHHIKCTF